MPVQPPIEIDSLSRLENITSFMDKIGAFYAFMDQKYGEVAKHYGFNCEGCDDNCCQTRFYHHTILEYLYLKKGFDQLGDDKKTVIEKRARDVIRETESLEKGGMPVRLMCPLNFKGACILYLSRPMICRLHGLPHELQKPGEGIIKSPGCEEFTNRCKEKNYYRFDRTLFYGRLAEMEKNLRQATEITGRFKMTIARMLLL